MVINQHFTIHHKTIKKDITIAVLSDLHFNKYLPKKLLQDGLQNLKQERPTLIVIAGDLINSANELEYPKVVSTLQQFLNDLTKLAPVVACIGNHDIREVKKVKYFPSSINKIKEVTKDIHNFYLLDHSHITLHDITFYDLTLPFHYYVNVKHREDCKVFKKSVKQLKIAFSSHFNILLCHSPINIHQMNQPSINLVISGHMHHGLVPNIIDKIWKSDRGLIGPHKQLFPKYARGWLTYPTPHLISGGITKIPFPPNRLFASHIEYIHLKK